MMSARSGGSGIALVLSGMSLSLRLQLVQVVSQAIEAVLPEHTVVLEPPGGVLERTHLEPAWAPLRLATARHQAGALEHLEMLRDSGKRHLEGPGELLDRRLARGEASKDCAP